MSKYKPTTIEKFLRYVQKPEDPTACWIWCGWTNPKGYGKTSNSGLAHRVSYELFREPIPEGLEIDHLCRIRNCVNPDHLEVVTHRTNVIRGTMIDVNSAKQRAKTHCPKGHPYSEENTYISGANKSRHCRTCRREQIHNWQLIHRPAKSTSSVS